jgi:hypothetical protein
MEAGAVRGARWVREYAEVTHSSTFPAVPLYILVIKYAAIGSQMKI